jgi:hypothetical protein
LVLQKHFFMAEVKIIDSTENIFIK